MDAIQNSRPVSDELRRRLEQLSPTQRALFESKLSQTGATPASAHHIPRLPAGADAPLTPGQEVLWTLQRALPAEYAYNVPRVLEICGALEVDAIRAALDAIVARHDMLRTRFIATDAGPRQLAHEPRPIPLEIVDLRNLLHVADTDARETVVRQMIDDRIRIPFVLESDLQLRATVLRVDDDSWRLLLVSHHIASDESSRDILFRELEQLYNAARSGTLDETLDSLPVPAVRYADFAAWQIGQLEGGALDEQLAYWRTRLAGLGVLELPTDRPRTSTPNFAGARHRFALPADLRPGVIALAREHGTTPFIVLLAAVKAMLYRYTGQRDVAVGTPVSGRHLPELEHVIGYLPSQVVLRTDVDPSLTFADLVARARETFLGAFEHQDIPIERIAAQMIDRPSPAEPLFRVNVQMAGGKARPPRFANASVSIAATDVGTAKFDLIAGFEDGPSGLQALFEYRTDLFDAATIERMAGHLTTLLAGVVENPGVKIADAPMLTAAERAQILEEWNDTASTFDCDAVVPDLVHRAARQTPNAVAVRGGDGRTLSFAELEANADRLAVLLQSRGVRPGVCVGVYMHRTPELMTALLGVLKAGGAYVPIDPIYPPARIEVMLADSSAKCVLTHTTLVERLENPAARMVLALNEEGWPIDVQYPSSDEQPKALATADDLAYVIYTSGSTGKPKGAMITHRGLVNYLQWAVQAYEVDRGVGAPVHSSISFDLTVTSMWTPLLASRTVVMVPDDAGVDGLVALMRDETNFSLVKITPAHLELLQQSLGPDSVRGRVRYFVIGGEALYGESLAFWQAYAPETIHVNEYGPTETVVGCCVEFVAAAQRVSGQVPIGHPIPNTRLYVLDKNGQPVPVGVPGELLIGGEGVCAGYLGRPELTAEKFIADPFVQNAKARLYKTGDLARWRADGVLEYLGRADDQVKLRGYRIELGEIEEAVGQQSGVEQCTVIVREDCPGDRRLVAYIVPEAGQLCDAEATRSALRDMLPDYMVPSALVFIGALPLSSNGKVDRRALLAMPAPDSGAATSEISPRHPPRTPLERTVWEEWQMVLRRDDFGVDDDFFDLGGHSLLAMRIVGRIVQRTGVRVPLRTVFERRTIAGIAAAIEASHQRAPSVEIPPLASSAEAPLSFGQELLWLMQVATPQLSAYNIPQLWRLQGPVDTDALERALQLLVQRHDALHTVIVAEGDRASQRLLDPAPVLEVEILGGSTPRDQRRTARRRVEELAAMPFDLTRDRPFRVVLLRLAPEEHWLLQVTHHSIADAWSAGVMARDLSLLYAAAVRGEKPELPPVAVQYRAFALWQRATLSDEWLRGELAWWRNELAGAPTTLELPSDHPRSPTLSFDGDRRVSLLPVSLLADLKALATAEGTTLFSVLLAAYAVLLHRYTRQKEIVIGTVVGNRPRADLENTVGYLANTLPLRVSLADDPPFTTLIRRIHEVFLRASEHADVPFERLALELHDGARSSDPLVQAMFLLQNHAESPLSLAGAETERLDIAATGAKVELTLSMAERTDGLRVVIQYRRHLFDETTIDRMLGHLSTILEAATEEPGEHAGTIAMVTPAEREALLACNPPVAPVRDAAVPSLIRSTAVRAPHATAVVASDQSLTYAELLDRSASFAASLASLGVGTGSRVAICMGRRADLFAALLGVLRTGAAYVPLDPTYPVDRIAHVLEDAAVHAIVVDGSAPRLDPHGVPILNIESAIPPVRDAEFTDAPVTAESLAYVLYTSGSTGRPKGVMIPHRALTNFLLSMADKPGLTPADAILAVTTVSFDMSVPELWLALITGARVVVASRAVATDGNALRDLIERTAAEHPSGRVLLQGTPGTWRLLIEAGWSGTRNLIMLCGGEAWPPSLATQLLSRGGELWNMYGPTETTVWSTRERVTSADISLGEPLANTTLFVLEPSGDIAPLGVAGELWIGGAGLALGYYGRPDLTAERFVERPELGGRLYSTGDLVRRSTDGRLTYLGRLDDQVKVRGYRIELGEIESVIAGTPEVVQVVASVQRAGETARLVCHVVLTEAGKAAEEMILARLLDRLRRSLPEYMVPSAIMRLDALPLTRNGKVDRRALPVPDAGATTSARPYVAPRSSLEREIAEVWRDVLGVERVGVDDDFFALGGHSLLAMRAVARLGHIMPVRLTLASLFEARTVAALAAYAVQALASTADATAENDLERILAELEALSEDEAARLQDAPSVEGAR